ncbi:FAD-binding oxidoreductase [Kroppenstedtia guangzhouensis]|nr:FAD-binding oxidoreductase [Kroppenstedtia guangzhouensis]
MKTIETDFAVVGGGLAGFMTAWHLAGHGQVHLFTKTCR